MIHELRTWPEYFKPLSLQLKTFEIRKNDRNFVVGDILILKEYEPRTNSYSGREITKIVSYILDSKDFDGIKEGYCILGIVDRPNIYKGLN